MKKFLVPLLFLCMTFAFAQEQPREAITTNPLFTKLLGSWEGEGWSIIGPNQKVEFLQTEVVEAKANGHVVIIEGLGRDKETNELVFQAFGYFSYDFENESYSLSTFQTDGYSTTMEPEITDSGFIWGFDVPQGTLKYTATISDTSWNEIGEFSPDGGTTWFPTFEMNLSKTE